MGEHELDAVRAGGYRFPWADVDGEALVAAVAALTGAGLAVRLSSVGYGIAARVGVVDGRGWGTGWTLGSPEELGRLCSGLYAAGGVEYVMRSLEKPVRRR